MSDFGTLSVVPDRFMTPDGAGDSPVTASGEQALVLDPTMASIATLRPFQSNLLAKTGDVKNIKCLLSTLYKYLTRKHMVLLLTY